MMTEHFKKYVTYLRVSTKIQGAGNGQGTGYGIDAQREICTRYLAACKGVSIASFVEIEGAGSKVDRPELEKAISLAKQEGATLLVSKLDRLSRSVSFVSHLIEAGTDLKIAEMPFASVFELQLLSVFAEFEKTQIGLRTKAGLAAAKKKGIKLGAPDSVLLANRTAWNQIQKKEADARAKEFEPVIQEILAKGLNARQTANELNRLKIPTAKGKGKKIWHHSSVLNLMKRLSIKK